MTYRTCPDCGARHDIYGTYRVVCRCGALVYQRADPPNWRASMPAVESPERDLAWIEEAIAEADRDWDRQMRRIEALRAEAEQRERRCRRGHLINVDNMTTGGRCLKCQRIRDKRKWQKTKQARTKENAS